MRMSSTRSAIGARVLLISGGGSIGSWVLVCALRLSGNEELQAVMLGGGWNCGGSLLAKVPLQ